MNLSLPHRWHLLATYLKPLRLRATLLCVMVLGSIGLQLLNPQILRYFIDTAAVGGAVALLVQAALFFISVALLTQVLSVAATYFGEQVGWGATNVLRADLALHCLNLDLPFHHKHTPGEMIERIDSDITALANLFSQLVIRILGNFLLMLGVLVVVWLEDWRVGAVLSLFSIVAFLVLNWFSDRAVPHFTAEREANANLYGFLEERLNALEDVRANGGGAYAMQRFFHWMRELYSKGRTAGMFGASLWLVTNVLFTIGILIVFGSGAYLFQAGSLTIGTVYLFVQYTMMLQQPLEEIAEQMKEFQRAGAGVIRVQELLNLRPTILDGPGAEVAPGPLAVEFRDVTFAYDQDEPVVQHLDFRLEPGTVLGLLGRTGSGKTTMTRLLQRLYDPAAGAILVGGQDVRDARLADLRGWIGIVTQDVQLFQASVRDNLTFFDPAIDDERIEQVLRDIGLWEWCAALPDGLDTELAAGGGGLSAGEAQLLAFTRVFLRDPGLVILDEASSRLDPATERLVDTAIARLLEDRTGIIIAHRLGTVARADEIMILDNGSIAEHGARETLLRDESSRFAHLMRTGLEEVLA